jgi:hypothetical protein
MAEVVVNVPDNQISFFMDLLKKLGYTTDAKAPKVEQWHVDLVEKRMQKYKKKPYPLKDAHQVVDDIIKKL